MKTQSLSAICDALEIRRTMVDKWISDGVIRPSQKPENGHPREWTFAEAMVLGVVAKVTDVGLSVRSLAEIVPTLSLYAFRDEPAYLVISWRRGRLVPVTSRGSPGPHPNELPRNGPYLYETKIVKARQLVTLVQEQGGPAFLVVPLNPIEERLLSIWPVEMADEEV